jgi:hypothetical protein
VLELQLPQHVCKTGSLKQQAHRRCSWWLWRKVFRLIKLWLFDGAISTGYEATSDGRIIVNDKLERTWKMSPWPTLTYVMNVWFKKLQNVIVRAAGLRKYIRRHHEGVTAKTTRYDKIKYATKNMIIRRSGLLVLNEYWHCTFIPACN